MCIETAAASAQVPPPIVYTIAGSDSGGGAGIQADLHAIHGMGCHGCSAITCLTAQNSVAVTAVHTPPASFLREQLDALNSDMPPDAIKVGMLGSVELATEVGKFLKEANEAGALIVVDPVMISTSGHRLIDTDAQKAMIELVFPYAHILTPNKYEAEALLGRKLKSPQDVEKGANDLLKMGLRSVLIKGGHSLIEGGDNEVVLPDVNATLGYAQDFFLSSEEVPEQDERMCDGAKGVWLRSVRFDSEHTHGTGCTLSSAIASALAIGSQRRRSKNSSGAESSINLIDACCLGKAYVTQGIGRGVRIGKGSGPVFQTHFPNSSRHFPSIVRDPSSHEVMKFKQMRVNKCAELPKKDEIRETNIDELGCLFPIVDSLEWVKKVSALRGITDIQLRIKNEKSKDVIIDIVKEANAICKNNNIRLWINDFWEAAIQADCYGVHVGQEDLMACYKNGGIDQLKNNNLALGISTHSFAELSVALALNPTYISLGPIFGTTSKSVAFSPQGTRTIKKWRELIPGHIPLMVIGGINDVTLAEVVKDAGANSVAVIGAITKADKKQEVVDKFTAVFDL